VGEWDDHQIMGHEDLETSEMAAREEFLRNNPPLTGLSVPEDLRTIGLIKRPWRNNKGLWFDLADNHVIQAHLAEIPPGGHTTRHRHTTEAYIYIVKGTGYSIVNYEGEPEQRIEWSEGTLFSPPVWAWHQHFNSDPEEAARYLAIQDTGLVRHLRLHRIERHPSQKKMGEGDDYDVEAQPASSSDVVPVVAGVDSAKRE
jgi:gentisate 1,2-dioxygenase